jgi:hypothetical protein
MNPCAAHLPDAARAMRDLVQLRPNHAAGLAHVREQRRIGEPLEHVQGDRGHEWAAAERRP